MTYPNVDFYLKQGDLLPILKIVCRDATGAVVSLSGYTAARFQMQSRLDYSQKVDAPAQVDDAPNGVISYSWIENDTDLTGLFNAQFRVVMAGGKPLTFPNDGHLLVEITDKL